MEAITTARARIDILDPDKLIEMAGPVWSAAQDRRKRFLDRISR
jgi:hypothetical protein